MRPASPQSIRKAFSIGEFDGETAATISCVNYSASFAFLGFYIVRADLRGRGWDCRYGTQPSRTPAPG